MKLNVLYITFAIGLLTQSSQGAPLLGNNVADVTSDQVDVPIAGVKVTSDGINVDDQGSLLTKRQELGGGVVGDAEKLVHNVVSPSEGVQASLDGTGSFTEKLSNDLGITHMSRRASENLVENAPVAGQLTGPVASTLDGVTGLRKRTPLLDNYGQDSTKEVGAGLLSGYLNKRQALLDGTVGQLTQNVGLSNILPAEALKKRDGSNDDDGEDRYKHQVPPGATHGSGMAANNPAAFIDAMTKRDGSNDDDGEDRYKHQVPPGATHGSGMAANNPATFIDAMTKRDESNDDDGEDLLRHQTSPGATFGSNMAANDFAAYADAMTKRDDEGDDDSNDERKQDRPGPPPSYFTDEQLDDFYEKRDVKFRRL